jgi:PBP1b-binding outer membrane lipoprotein LpoB
LRILHYYVEYFPILSDKTNTDWENKTYSFSDLMENISEGDFSEVDISNVTNVLENFEMFGMDPNAMSNIISNLLQVE